MNISLYNIDVKHRMLQSHTKLDFDDFDVDGLVSIGYPSLSNLDGSFRSSSSSILGGRLS